MTKKEVYKKYKEIQKERAAKIRELKNSRKLENRGDTPLWKIEYEIRDLKYKFRHLHIAICLLRGRTYEEIECKTAEGNNPNFRIIEELKNEIMGCISDSEKTMDGGVGNAA